jgi:hypothetical protein
LRKIAVGIIVTAGGRETRLRGETFRGDGALAAGAFDFFHFPLAALANVISVSLPTRDYGKRQPA